MSHPDALPDLFVDRSLGRIRVLNLLREAGLRLVTLSEHYGIPQTKQFAMRNGSNSPGSGARSSSLRTREFLTIDLNVMPLSAMG